ncbi:MAG: GNAT family N-acetyltransferase [Flavobacteriaceae bacterium]|nr:GNAT family N-acetyltransferase [Flavobacteriaceae bacterium]
MHIRSLIKEDYPKVSHIYGEGMATGIATFETKVPDWEEWNVKFLNNCRFVILLNDEIVGWCAISLVSKRKVYEGVVENTLYVSKAHQGKGLGARLLEHLIVECENCGYYTLQAGIFPQNIASIELHKKFGFREIGYREKIAQRDGLWHDNILLERRSKKINYMKNVLVLCTGNSCRSQMAHGYLKKLAGDKAQIFSAGIETHGLNPGAVSIMAEDNIDISSHTSNHVDEYQGINWDFIITVCDHANENCPFIPAPNAQRLHHNFFDPSKVEGSEEEKHAAFLKARNEIRDYCRSFIESKL